MTSGDILRAIPQERDYPDPQTLLVPPSPSSQQPSPLVTLSDLLPGKYVSTTARIVYLRTIERQDALGTKMIFSGIIEEYIAKSFNDICKENNITTIQQALTCKQICSFDNGLSLCYDCHKNLEKLRVKIRKFLYNTSNNRLWQQHVWLALLSLQEYWRPYMG
jgi:hypothetical protein